MAIFMRRPVDKETGKPIIGAENCEPRPITVLADPAFNLHETASKATRQRAIMHRVFSLKPYKQQIGASFRLAHQASRVLQKALLANNALSLPTRNVYRSIDPKNITAYGDSLARTLNPEQLMVFSKLQAMRGPIALVQGPPGTGKTFTLLMIAMIFIQYRKISVPEESPEESPEAPAAGDFSSFWKPRAWNKSPDAFEPVPSRPQNPRPTPSDPSRHQILLVAPTNAAADHLAMRVDQYIKDQVKPDSEGKKPRIVRVYPLAFEKAVYQRPGDNTIVESPDQTAAEDLVETLNTSIGYKSFCDYVQKSKPRLKGSKVVDPRVKLHGLSLHHQIMQHAEENPKWRQWLNDRDDFAAGDHEGISAKDFTDAGRKILQQVLADADVVVTTMFLAGQHLVFESIHPDAVFVDEAAMTSETDFWPIFARYDPAPFILFGDHHQLQSIVKSTPENNQFSQQMRYSPFARYAYSGYMVSLLLEQHRMVDDLHHLVGGLFYSNEWRIAPEVSIGRNEAARRIRVWNGQGPPSLYSNLIFVDVPNSITEKQGTSSYNMLFAARGVWLCGLLIENAKWNPSNIVILCPYQAQLREYQRKLAEAHADRPQLGYSSVDVRTIDSFQGQERAIVILDMTFTDKIGFMKDPHRLNVALGRAQKSMYVIYSRKGLNRNMFQGYFVRQFADYINRNRLTWSELPPLPTTPDPSQAEGSFKTDTRCPVAFQVIELPEDHAASTVTDPPKDHAAMPSNEERLASLERGLNQVFHILQQMANTPSATGASPGGNQ